ncbi:MAG: hypothetical protein R3Y29_07190 [bacterium]
MSSDMIMERRILLQELLKNGLRITNSRLVYGGIYYNSGADYA